MKIEKNNQKRITKIIQETHHRFLNLFCMDVRHRNGEASEYYVASRAKSVTDLKAVTHRNEPDGVSIYSVYGEQRTELCWCGSIGIRLAIMFMSFRQALWRLERQ